MYRFQQAQQTPSGLGSNLSASTAAGSAGFVSITHEATFEANIEAHLLGHGWQRLAPAGYDRKNGVFGDEIIAFVQQSQPKEWAKLVTRHGGEAMARDKFVKAVVAALDHRGTISVLRSPVKDSGVSVRLCYFKPASGLNEQQTQRYAANRLSVATVSKGGNSTPRAAKLEPFSRCRSDTTSRRCSCQNSAPERSARNMTSAMTTVETRIS